MIVVTGGAGFIGSNLVRMLNDRGEVNVVVVDDLSNGHKCANLADCTIADYLDRDEWRRLVESDAPAEAPFRCVYHLGACSDTTLWDGRHMMDVNFAFSRATFQYCARHGIPLVYASSAAVYGASSVFEEDPPWERPLNVYGYSKLAFDQYVRAHAACSESLVVGLRYFNVYGPREAHKGRMASAALHFYEQVCADGSVRLFGASHGCADGEHRRDFIHVDDAVAVTLWFGGQTAEKSGIYNCGTGRAETFNAVARAVIDGCGRGGIEYVDMPDDLRPAYQAYTQADLSRLRAAGYTGTFRTVAQGVREYLHWLA